jgi:hypothetical protein
LGVRRLKEFNIALLRKWCWRCLVDRDGLWFKVLSSCYGEEGGRIRDGGRRGSAWWREIVRIQEGIGVEGGSWFEENISKSVGNNLNTFFWIDCWVGPMKLRERFRRLYDLSIHKDNTVREMKALGWGKDGNVWRWRRRLMVWEEEVVGDSRPDAWTWRPNAADGYTVRGVYRMLMRQEMHVHDDSSDVVWHKNAPLKVSICVWRLLRNRWPTKDNLRRRGVISLDSQLCVSGCGQIESADHLIIHCPFFGSLWQHVRNWLGVYFVDPQCVLDHCQQFRFSTGGYYPRRSFLHMI